MTGLGDDVLEGLEGNAAGDVGRGTGLDDAGFFGEGVDALAGLAGLAALDLELGAAVEGESFLGVQLSGDHLLEGSENDLDVLLVALGESGEGVDDLGLVHVLRLRLGDGHG